MLQSHQAMLSPALQTLEATEAYIPNGNHSFFQRMVLSEANSILGDILTTLETASEEKQKSESVLTLLTDAVNIFTREAENPDWIHMSLGDRKAKVKAIQDAPQIPQRSEEWFRNYSKVLTASEFSALFVNNKKRRDLVYSKANLSTDLSTNFRNACPTEELTAIGWGIRFEPVVKLLIEHRDRCKIYEPGRLHHKTNTHLAASPDGVFESSSNPKQVGRLVEIKCPYSRAIGKEIPSEYWIQMQIQMEVADVDECEYIEVELVSRKPKHDHMEVVDLSGTTYQGKVYLLKKDVEDGEPFDYQYVYGEVDSVEIPSFPEGYSCIEEIPWGLKSWHRVVVSRDRVWYNATKPWQESFWDDVEKVRGGEVLASPSFKAMKQEICLITDD